MEENVKKAFTRLYFVRQLKLAIIAEKEVLTFYMISIRPIVEYACPVFHSGSSKYMSDELECIQKRAVQFIFSNIHHQDVLKMVRPSYERREYLTNTLFEEICSDPNQQKQTHFLLSMVQNRHTKK
jgi:hypothetical protein